MPEKKIYIIDNEEQKGPFTVAELRLRGITGDTPVWMPGMADWKTLDEVPELKTLLDDDSAFGTYAQPDVSDYNPMQRSEQQDSGQQQQPQPQEFAQQQPQPQLQPQSYPDPEYYAMIAGIQFGPMPVSMLLMRGLTPATPVWREGMADWMPASTRSDIMNIINMYQQGQAPFQAMPGMPGIMGKPYNQIQGQMYPYQENQQVSDTNPRTNWRTAAIISIVLGLCSLVSTVVGIIGLVFANKANKAYDSGDYIQGDRYNTTAKTLVIIGLIVGAVGFSLVATELLIIALQ